MRIVRSWSLFVWAAFWILPPYLSSGRLDAQQSVPFFATTCAANSDCANYLGDFDLLSERDRQLVALPGKRPANRSQILSQASSYLAEHYPAVDLSLHFRYLSCVSNALWSERGENKTLFSSENIIETYFALADRDAEVAPSIQHACDLLKAYHSRLEQARAESTILQRHKDGPDPQYIWHTILLDFARKKTPRQNAEVNVRRLQERYCLFATQCRTAANSPFAGK